MSIFGPPNVIKWLEGWYKSYCDGDWEHDYGVQIETFDNPGWSIEINLVDTDLENKPFKNIEYEKTDTDWVHCKVCDKQFYGAGGPEKLLEILEIFKKWADS